MTSKRKQHIPPLVKIALFCFAIYGAVCLVKMQLQISDKQMQLETLNEQISRQTMENNALRESVEQGASDEYIASIAREKLGYAFPNERVFVDASSQ